MGAPDLSEFEAATKPRRQRCWYQRMTDPEREKVDAALDAGHPSHIIAAVVSDWGYPIKGNTVLVHARGACSCG